MHIANTRAHSLCHPFCTAQDLRQPLSDRGDACKELWGEVWQLSWLTFLVIQPAPQLLNLSLGVSQQVLQLLQKKGCCMIHSRISHAHANGTM